MALLLRRLLVRRSLRPLASIPPSLSDGAPLISPTRAPYPSGQLSLCRSIFCSRPSQIDQRLGPAPVDNKYLLAEEEFHRLADTTLEGLQERLEEYGDSIQLDGFDIDYGNQVLTLKLGSVGTYVINKQTPNRQIWVSSPVSGPSRFDWDEMSKAWVYRRTKANLHRLLEDEVGKLCAKPITLS